MRGPLLILCLMAGCRERGDAPPADPSATAEDAAPVGEITLPAPVPHVGDVIELDAETTVSAKVRMYKKGAFGGFLTLAITHRRQTRAEVKGGGQVQVTFVVDRMTDVASGAERALPVEGKTYVFGAHGVTAADGSAPPSEEDAIVRREAPSLVTASALPEMAAGRRLKLGSQEDAPPDAIARLSAGGLNYTRLSWLFKGRRGTRLAVLGWTGAIEDKWVNGLDLKANLVGEVVIEAATGKTIEATCDGPAQIALVVKERGKEATYIGNGRMSVRVKRR